MTAKLCSELKYNFCNASARNDFFDGSERAKVNRFEKLEQPSVGSPTTGCKTNLYFGFFFDGTKNNYVLAEKNKTHSNIARLYDCYPGLSVPNVLPKITDWEYDPSRYTHFFRTYIPGVSSPFKDVNDSGQGLDLQRGAATGYLGEARIIWALLQALNNVHRYFLKAPLLTPQETTSFVKSVVLNKSRRRQMTPAPGEVTDDENSSADHLTRQAFEEVLGRLHCAVKQHWPDKKAGRPPKIDPGIVRKIHISIFGFSRGATQARAYTNWLMSLCKLDARLCGRGNTMTLGGFDVAFDFLGLFDSVASIGAGNTLGNSVLGKMFDGHGAWADAEESLRIPDNITCLHLVAAHEVRRSFPLDSIFAVGDVTTSNCTEIVLPGVHSDLGCGYAPGEQGRGRDPEGKDMLTRIPLLLMYQSARLAGVPLKLELASDIAKQRFAVAPETINAFNAYINACKTKIGSLTAIMREQGNYYMQWRILRRHTGGGTAGEN
ncbi:phospholipase effector Tle1 domain-containing protein [Massilia sp. S19_KUP03_FR1]|uniref:phospholipase effector Tle1 domain-containing protein n=1 Tax=Massilia sp. S19_KUP03_FR1 TaxID=3025503 RepID=UPI002FCD7A6C